MTTAIKLDFDFDSALGESVARYRAPNGDLYRVRAVQDQSPDNPFDSWEGHWPMIVDYQGRGHHFREYDKAPGHCIDEPFRRFSDGLLIRKQGAICEALGDIYDGWTWKRIPVEADLANHKRDYRKDYVSGRAGMAALLRDYFTDSLAAVADRDKLEALAALYGILGIPCLCTSSRGYSQGDYSELLIVATPEAAAQFGWKGNRPPEKIKADMEAQARLYTAWAWGDVYGFCVERSAVPESDSDWEEVDSCWGFYGDVDESGIAEAAADAIAYDITERKAARADRLKSLIRNRVPLDNRAALLA